MIPLKKSLSVALGLVVLATTALLITTGTVGAQSSHLNLFAAPPPPSVPVTVVNTPLQVTGTVNANIGIPTVNVNSLPGVQLTGTSSVNVTNPSLTIGNPASNPVLVSDVADSVNQEYFNNLCQTNDPTNAYCAQNSVLPVVPSFTADSHPVKQLVIDFVSGNCIATPGDDIMDVSVNTPGVSGESYFVVPVKIFSNASGSSWSFAQMTKIFAYPGSQIALVSHSNQLNGSYENCGATINGHLVTQ
jgi:hypothetical protein